MVVAYFSLERFHFGVTDTLIDLAKDCVVRPLCCGRYDAQGNGKARCRETGNMVNQEEAYFGRVRASVWSRLQLGALFRSFSFPFSNRSTKVYSSCFLMDVPRRAVAPPLRSQRRYTSRVTTPPRPWAGGRTQSIQGVQRTINSDKEHPRLFFMLFPNPGIADVFVRTVWMNMAHLNPPIPRGCSLTEPTQKSHSQTTLKQTSTRNTDLSVVFQIHHSAEEEHCHIHSVVHSCRHVFYRPR